MAIQDDSTVLCKGDLKAYHESILPYLGGNFMLGTNVSDYYSTDEKIVGVWTDGKPVYQIVIIGNMASSDSVVWTTNELINVKSMTGVVARSDGGEMPIPFTYPGVSQDIILYFHKHDAVTDMHLFAKSNLDQGRPYELIVQYTKDSDTANSAVTTPGCYDINFPNTWPENTEIYFGNGLYGYRATGTFNANTTDQLVILKRDFAPATLIECGGVLKRSIIGWYDFCVPYYYSGMYGSICINSDGHLALCEKDSGAISNCPYDVWVTYTK